MAHKEGYQNKMTSFRSVYEYNIFKLHPEKFNIFKSCLEFNYATFGT